MIDQPLARIALIDCLSASADDHSIPLTRRTATRLADRALEHLSCAGWHLTRDEPDR